MKTTRERLSGMMTSAACALVLLGLCMLCPAAARAQWTTSGTNTTTTNNVGVGTTAPETSLHVSTSSTAAGRGITNEQTSADGNSSVFTFKKSRGGAAVQNTDNIGNVWAAASDGTSFIAPARMRFSVDGAVSAGSVPVSIQFFTGNNANGVERMRISSGGNVGIGIAAPTARLHILGESGASGAAAAPTAFSVTGGAGGNSAAAGGAGGDLFLQGGAGGWNTTGSSSFYSGNGGAVSLMGGTGGQHLFGVSHAGTGGPVNITGGTGGAHNVSGFAGGAGGSIVLNGGVGGTGSTPGPAGNVVLANLRGNVGVGITSPASRLHVGGQADNLFQVTATGSAASDTVANFSSAAGNILIVRGNGNVGVGTGNPAQKLDVAGSVNASGFCLSDGCKTAWSQVGGGTSSQWTTSGTSVYYNTGNVGVGTSSPNERLGVQGMVGLYPQAWAQPSTRGMFMFHGGGGGSIYAYNYLNGTPDPITISAATVDFNTYVGGTASQRMFIANDGNVGLGTNAPASLLNLVGANASLTFGTAGAADASAFSVAVTASGENTNSGNGRGLTVKAGDSDNTAGKVGGNLTLNPGAPVAPATSYGNVLMATAGGNVGIGTAAPAIKLDVTDSSNNGSAARFVQSNATASNGVYIQTQTAHASDMAFAVMSSGGAITGLAVRNSGNVGIGTTNPGQKLEVRGNLTLEAATSPTIFTGTGAGELNRYLNILNSPGLLSASGLRAGGVLISDDYSYASPAKTDLVVKGRVGIGTPGAAAYKLDVAGSVNASGLCLGGDCKTNWSQIGGTGASSAANVSSGQFGSATGGGNYSFPSNVLINSGAGSIIDAGAGNKFRVCGPNGTCMQAGEYIGGRIRLSVNGSFASAEAIADPGMGGIHAPGNAYVGGNVGVGTTAPAAKLDVNGNVNVTGNLTASGNISARYQDVAEWVPSTQKLQAGTVVILDAGKTNHVVASGTAYDTKVAGVISAQPGISLGEAGEGKLLVATTGRVRVKVDATRGAVKVGDLLVTSDLEGVAMKSVPLDLGGVPIHRPGTVIGKALEPLEKGVGEILVLLSLQ